MPQILVKIVSTKITQEDFAALRLLARKYWNEEKIKMPQVSHVLRYIIHDYIDNKRKIEK